MSAGLFRIGIRPCQGRRVFGPANGEIIQEQTDLAGNHSGRRSRGLEGVFRERCRRQKPNCGQGYFRHHRIEPALAIVRNRIERIAIRYRARRRAHGSGAGRRAENFIAVLAKGRLGLESPDHLHPAQRQRLRGRDIGIRCSFSRADGNPVTERRQTIHDTVKKKSRKTFARMHVGFINITADRAKCSLLTASRV
jgi:hypothetical protein